MNVDGILSVFNRHQVRYLLIGGMNFLLRHKPVTTYDVDFWIEDTDDNRRACESALAELGAEWGATEEEWESVNSKPAGWLNRQAVYCLSSPQGAIDIFRQVRGLAAWSASFENSVSGQTAAGTAYRGLSDRDMLKCQTCLEPESQKLDRIRELKETLRIHE